MTAADRPSVTDNARAEALQRWPSINIVERLSGRSQTHRERTLQREAFTDGADWAAGRAEAMARELLVQTLTANPDEAASESSWEWARRIVGRLLDAGRAETTAEDIQTLDARWFERWETEQPLADKYAGYYQGRVSAVAQCREELRRLLATARTRPTCGATTNDVGPCVLDPDHITVSAHTGPSGWSWNDDVTMARFGDDDEEADRG